MRWLYSIVAIGILAYGAWGPSWMDDLSEVAVQPLAAFSDCMTGKLRSTRLPPPPATD